MAAYERSGAKPLAEAQQWQAARPQAGQPVDVTFAGVYVVVVTYAIGSLVESLAPADIQRIPARIEGRDERYDLLHVMSRIDCKPGLRAASF